MSTDERRDGATGNPGLTWFCPACFARNRWRTGVCVACGASLEVAGNFDERLVWALRHPDTATAVRAAQALGARRARSAVPALRETAGSPDVYRAAAAAAALRSFVGEPSAEEAIRVARRHPSVIVRRAVDPEQGLDDDGAS
jgi:HEAT repeat protein